MIRTLLLAFVALAILAGCGRKAPPAFPEGARTDAPTLPRKGEPTLYPY